MKTVFKPALLIFLLFLPGLLIAQPGTKRAIVSQNLQLLKSERQSRIARFHLSNAARPRFNTREFLLVDVTPNGVPIYRAPLNANARVTTGVEKFHTGELGIDLQGQGMTIGIWEAGKVTPHIELGDRITPHEDVSPHEHAMHVTGTILASGINPAAKGMAPLAKGSTWFYDDDYNEMYYQADTAGLMMSNHSYGSLTGWFRSAGVWTWTGDTVISKKEDYRFGLYGVESNAIDQIADFAPYYTIVWAAGNDRWEVGNGAYPPDGNEGTGYDCLIQEAVAKNTITVGAVERVLNYADPSSVIMSTFTSWGPTDDGRIKPDVVGDGVDVFSLKESPNLYSFLTGTSMSTPNVSGSLLLLQELYKRLHANRLMRSSTVKALAIHTARESGIATGPDYRFGWGLLAADDAAEVLLQEDHVGTQVNELLLANSQVRTFPMHPVAGKKITATIAWIDPPGTPPPASLDPTTPMLVNDLDIRITDLDGNEILPWILDPANPASAATTGDNIRDNVERIDFELPEDKPYNLTVSHKGELFGGSQAFSLIVTYESKFDVANTFYWVGGNGVWSDNAHWSLTSGGPTAGLLPGALDNVVVDNNSFSGIEEDTLTLDADVEIKSLLWMNNKPGVFALDSNTLTLNNKLTLSSATFRTATSGTIEFDGDGEVNIQTGGLENDTLTFQSGDWVINNKLSAYRLNVHGENIKARNAMLSVKHMLVDGPGILDLTETEIHDLEFLGFNNITLQTQGTRLMIDNPASFDFNGIDFDGTIDVEDTGILGIFSDNDLDSLVISGTVALHGNNHINYLVGKPAAIIDMEFEKIQTIAQLDLLGAEDSLINLRSNATPRASLNIEGYQQLCFDYLLVDRVDLEGNAVVTAGENSVVLDAENWLVIACDDVLYPDFDVTSTCAHGLTQFTSTSGGPVETWTWDFGDGSPVSHERDPKHMFSSPGLVEVLLTVSKGTYQAQYRRSIEIFFNSVEVNTIVQSGAILSSKNDAASYQWFKNDEAIEGAINKTYPFDESGSYTVLTSNAECNYLTDPFIILGADEPTQHYTYFPNPADHQVSVRFLNNRKKHQVTLYNAMGKLMISQANEGNDAIIDVRGFTSGIYILDADGYKSKLVVRH